MTLVLARGRLADPRADAHRRGGRVTRRTSLREVVEHRSSTTASGWAARGSAAALVRSAVFPPDDAIAALGAAAGASCPRSLDAWARAGRRAGGGRRRRWPAPRQPAGSAAREGRSTSPRARSATSGWPRRLFAVGGGRSCSAVTVVARAGDPRPAARPHVRACTARSPRSRRSWSSLREEAARPQTEPPPRPPVLAQWSAGQGAGGPADASRGPACSRASRSVIPDGVRLTSISPARARRARSSWTSPPWCARREAGWEFVRALEDRAASSTTSIPTERGGPRVPLHDALPAAARRARPDRARGAGGRRSRRSSEATAEAAGSPSPRRRSPPAPRRSRDAEAGGRGRRDPAARGHAARPAAGAAGGRE